MISGDQLKNKQLVHGHSKVDTMMCSERGCGFVGKPERGSPPMDAIKNSFLLSRKEKQIKRKKDSL